MFEIGVEKPYVRSPFRRDFACLVARSRGCGGENGLLLFLGGHLSHQSGKISAVNAQLLLRHRIALPRSR